jgi:hypothetical protein
VATQSTVKKQLFHSRRGARLDISAARPAGFLP